MRLVRLACLAAALVSFPACGGGGGGDDDGDDTSSPDASIPEGFTELIGREWTISPGEIYKCVGIRVDRDMYINAFHTDNPGGEHHAVLTIADDPGGFGNTQLGEYDCNVNQLDLQMLFASGVGTDDLVFPDGVGMKINAGQFVHLNLHLFNTQPSGDITAHSRILVKEIAAADLVNEAEMVFAGTASINVPMGEMGDASGGCTFQNDATIMTYWPHMHQHAYHQKVDMVVGGSAMVLHDQEFTFGEQKNFPITPNLQVHANDSINVTCSYDNTDGTSDLTFGDSSTEEMCFTGIYRYPKQAGFFGLFDCVEGL
jgi:hypothetical protein